MDFHGEGEGFGLWVFNGKESESYGILVVSLGVRGLEDSRSKEKKLRGGFWFTIKSTKG